MEKLRAAVETEGETSVVTLAGFIDEHNALTGLVQKIPSGTAMIDLAGIERINSSGVRDWVNWLAALEANGTQPILVSCSPAIVAQINLVKNFTGNSAVKSFQVPYRCRECDEEKTITVETAEMTSPSASPPEVPCPSCKRAMEVDEMPQSYFAFLAQPFVQRDDLGRGSGASLSATGSNPIVKSRARTRERRANTAARQSQPSLSAYQTPPLGTKRQSSNSLLPAGKRPSSSRIALGSSERISGSQLAPRRDSALDTKTPASYTLMLVAIIGILLAGIAALAYVVLVH